MFWVGPVPVSWKKNEEAEMIRCFELALYQSRERRMKKWRWLNVLCWPCTSSWKKNEEAAEMIKCFELALYQSRERKTKKLRWLDVLSWPCTSLVKEEWRRRSSLKNPYLPLCVYLSYSWLFHSTILYIS